MALWQSVGFCHGVLNTDNMSILGLTIDFGPFGFLEYFDKKHICNYSDKEGRYSYESQPEICRWNLEKLAESLSEVTNGVALKEILKNNYWKEFEKSYYSRMKEKVRKK